MAAMQFWAADFEHMPSFLRWAKATDNEVPETINTNSLSVQAMEMHRTVGFHWVHTCWFKSYGGHVFCIPNVPVDLIQVKLRALPNKPLEVVGRVAAPALLQDYLAERHMDWGWVLHQPVTMSQAFFEPAQSFGQMVRWVQNGPIVKLLPAKFFEEMHSMADYIKEIKQYADHCGMVSTRRWKLWQLEQAAYLGYIKFDEMRKDEDTGREIYYFTSTHPKYAVK